MTSPLARGLKLGLGRAAARALARLRTPEAVQEFVNAIPMNFEPDGDTALSVAEVLRQRRAHCIEAAMLAACAFAMHGRPPLLMDMGADDTDDDHVIALFRRGRYWGAISKSNGYYLRWRDPIYRSLRELALSYFHEYVRRGRKTLRTYSVPVDLRRVEPRLWVTNPGFCEEIVDLLTAARHFRLLPPGGAKALRPVDCVERRAHRIDEYRAPKKPRRRRRL
jgi:hypothetical protein